MKQVFNKKSHEKFKKYFGIKDSPGKWDSFYIEKTNKYIKFISWIPGLKMVGIGNSISMNCSTKNSDIDLFIVTSPNRLWLVRILITIIFQLLGIRKTTKKHEGRFCLSFFSTTEGLNFGDLALKDDIYLYFWIVYFKPILDYDNTYKNFIKKNNSWADFNEYKNILKENKKDIKFTGKTWGKKYRILNLFEKILKKIFLTKTLKTYKTLGKPFGVIINDNILKFHDKDIRKKIKKELN